MEWNLTYGDPEDNRFTSLVESSDGGYALAGYLGNYDSPRGADFWLIKTNDIGEISKFPLWAVLPVLLASTLLAVLFKRSLLAKLHHI